MAALSTAERYPVSNLEKWDQTVLKRGEHHVSKQFISEVPYTICQNAAKVMQASWDSIKPDARKLCGKRVTDANMLFHLVLGQKVTVKQIARLMPGQKHADFLKVFLPSQASVNAQARIVANQNLSLGYLRDLTPDCLVELAHSINRSEKDWYLLADNLGFDTYSRLTTYWPIDLLKKLLESFPEVTLARISLECELLGMTAVCAFIQATEKVRPIPLGTITINYYAFFYGPVCWFDIQAIKTLADKQGIRVDWDYLILTKTHSKLYEYSRNSKTPPEELLLRDKRVTLKGVLEAFPKDFFNSFERGFWNSSYSRVSEGGVTYPEMVYITERIDTIPSKIFETLMQKHVGFTVNYQPTFQDFFMLYWQTEKGRVQNLWELCHTVAEILKAANLEKMGNELLEKMDEIRERRKRNIFLESEILTHQDAFPQFMRSFITSRYRDEALTIEEN